MTPFREALIKTGLLERFAIAYQRAITHDTTVYKRFKTLMDKRQGK